MRGILIAIEGINGCGKSTIINSLKEYFHQIGQTVCIYKFPNRNGYQGDRINKFLCNQEVFNYKYDMIDAFAANRLAENNKIISDLNNGYVVICDRYIASAIAYHIPFDATDLMIEAYYRILGYFDKHMIIPDKTYLIEGDFLHLRNETKQRYHYDPDRSEELLTTFKKIVPKCSREYTLIHNHYGKVQETIIFIINDINRSKYN